MVRIGPRQKPGHKSSLDREEPYISHHAGFFPSFLLQPRLSAFTLLSGAEPSIYLST